MRARPSIRAAAGGRAQRHSWWTPWS